MTKDGGDSGRYNRLDTQHGVYHDGYGSIMLAGCAGIPK